MIKEIIKKQAEIEEEMTEVIHRFLRENNDHPSSINVEIIPEKKDNQVCIQIEIKD